MIPCQCNQFFDALTHRRPYKEPWPIQVAVREILSETGTKFDPRVTDAFSELDHASLVQPAKHPADTSAAGESESPAGRGHGAHTDADADAA